MSAPMLRIIAPSALGVRGTDGYGSGAFGATRRLSSAGSPDRCLCLGTEDDHDTDTHYTHRGQDRIIEPTRPFPVPFAGVFTWYGFAYDGSWPTLRSFHLRPDGFPEYELKILYGTLAPGIISGGRVSEGQILGICSDVGEKYPGITPHLHYELRRNNVPVDPSPFMVEPS